MKVNLYDLKAVKIGQVDLNQDIFGYKINQDLLSQSVRVYLSNQRKAHAKAKKRSEVAGTTKKMWAQKGTGRARHSDRKAPIFVGGGVAHGPTGEQNYKLKMSKKMNKNAFRSALSLFAKNKHILVVSDFGKINAKTKQAEKFIGLLKKANKGLSSSKKIALVISPDDINVKQAFRNLNKINLVYTNSLNTYTILSQNFLIFSDKSLQFVNKNR